MVKHDWGKKEPLIGKIAVLLKQTDVTKRYFSLSTFTLLQVLLLPKRRTLENNLIDIFCDLHEPKTFIC